MQPTKKDVYAFWNDASCGEQLYLKGTDAEAYAAQARARYELEPEIERFARFDECAGLRVLEVGVGLGSDHQRFAQAGAILHGVDLTDRAVAHTRRRLEGLGLRSDLRVADAERLPFEDDTFDLVYSWGVIHHSPDTPTAAREIVRVLRPGGAFRVMIYHKHSMVGLMLWLRYALLRGRPFTSLASIYSRFLESPGTKAYSRREGLALFAGVENLEARSVLTHADLLSSGAGQRHEGLLLSVMRQVWPRWLIRAALPSSGLFLLIEGEKPRSV